MYILDFWYNHATFYWFLCFLTLNTKFKFFEIIIDPHVIMKKEYRKIPAIFYLVFPIVTYFRTIIQYHSWDIHIDRHDIEHFYHHKDSSGCPFIATPASPPRLASPSPTATTYLFYISVVLSFQEYISWIRVCKLLRLDFLFIQHNSLEIHLGCSEYQ